MMKLNRKALALLACAMLTVTAAGCGNPAENNENAPALEAMASLQESGVETDADNAEADPTEEPSDTAAPTEEPSTPTDSPEESEEAADPAKESGATEEPATTDPSKEPESTTKPTATPADTPAPTTEPAKEPAATAEPTPEPTNTPASPESAGAPPVIVSNPPAVSGLVQNTETSTSEVAHQRPAGMPEVCYSEDEALMAILMYGGVGDGYDDNGDGTWTYVFCRPDGTTTDTVTTTTTTDNWYKGTEADALAKLEELKGMYPHGAVWDENSTYDTPTPIDSYISNDNACAGFVKMVSDYMFGTDAPARAFNMTNLSQLRAGDIVIDVANDHAWVYTGSWYVSEIIPQYCEATGVSGNNNGHVAWDSAMIGNSDGSCSGTVITRYPQ